MDLIEVRGDGNEQLLATGLTLAEVHEVLDWWRYTKPFGPSVTIMVKEPTPISFGVSITGTECEPLPPLPVQNLVAEPGHSEIFVG